MARRSSDTEVTTEGFDMEEFTEELSNEDITTSEPIDDVAEGIDIPLIAPYYDKNGNVHTTFSLTHMDGNVEKKIDTPEMHENQTKAIAYAVTACCTSIGTLRKADMKPDEWKDIIYSLPAHEADYIFFKIRALTSIQNELELESKCPARNCQADNKTFFTMQDLTIKPFVAYRKDFTLVDGIVYPGSAIPVKKGYVRLATVRDRVMLGDVTERNNAAMTSKFIVKLTVLIDDSGKEHQLLEKTADDMTSKDRKIIAKAANELNYGLDMDVPVYCFKCGYKYTGNAQLANFI